jgi:hypothetical protein
MVAPVEGWRHLKALVEREEPKDVLRRMRSLLQHHYFYFVRPSRLSEGLDSGHFVGVEFCQSVTVTLAEDT